MSAARFYFGKVGHQRFGKIGHKLNYRIAYVLLDLDALNTANQYSALLGVDQPGPLSFRSRDHGDGKSDDLAGWVRATLRENGCTEEAAKIELLTLPRMFGYVFNPLSVYFIRGQDGQLHHVMYEVGNTFGERHFYLCATGADGPPYRHVCDKAFYVSPFFDVTGTYTFSLSPPAEDMSVHIRYDDAAGEKALTATLTGAEIPVSNGNCLKLIAAFPFMTLGVLVGIHWDALRLWLKGAVYHRHGPKTKRMRITREATNPPVSVCGDEAA